MVNENNSIAHPMYNVVSILLLVTTLDGLHN